MKSFIIVSLEVFGLHCWDDCNLMQVDFLKNQHRHKFLFKSCFEVSHDNRELEFIVVKDRIDAFLNIEFYDPIYRCLNFGSMSCEMLCKEVMKNFSNISWCEVWEDGENGARVER